MILNDPPRYIRINAPNRRVASMPTPWAAISPASPSTAASPTTPQGIKPAEFADTCLKAGVNRPVSCYGDTDLPNAVAMN